MGRSMGTTLAVAMLWLVASLVWGSAFFAMHLALRTFSAEEVAFLRHAVGAMGLVVAFLVLLSLGVQENVLWYEGLRVMRRRWRVVWPALTTLAFINNLMPIFFTCRAVAKGDVSSTATVVASAPLFTAVFSACMGARLNGPAKAGFLLGGLGLALTIFAPLGRAHDLGALAVRGKSTEGPLYALAASVCYGLGTVLTKCTLGAAGLHPIAGSTTQVTLAAVLGLAIVAGLPLTSPNTFPPPLTLSTVLDAGPWPLAGILFQGVLCTAVGFLLSVLLAAEVGAMALTSSWITFPVTGYVESAILLPKSFSELSTLELVARVLGAAFVMAAVYLVVVRAAKVAEQEDGLEFDPFIRNTEDRVDLAHERLSAIDPSGTFSSPKRSVRASAEQRSLGIGAVQDHRPPAPRAALERLSTTSMPRSSRRTFELRSGLAYVDVP